LISINLKKFDPNQFFLCEKEILYLNVDTDNFQSFLCTFCCFYSTVMHLWRKNRNIV